MTIATALLDIDRSGFMLERLILALKQGPDAEAKLRWLLKILTNGMHYATVDVINCNLSPANGEESVMKANVSEALRYVWEQLRDMPHFGGSAHELASMPIKIELDTASITWQAPGIHGQGVMYIITVTSTLNYP